MHVNIFKPLACVTAILDGRGFAERNFSRLVKMLIALEPNVIFIYSITVTYRFLQVYIKILEGRAKYHSNKYSIKTILCFSSKG